MTVPIIRVPPERKRRAAPDQSPSDTVTLVCTPRLASLFTLVAAPPLTKDEYVHRYRSCGVFSDAALAVALVYTHRVLERLRLDLSERNFHLLFGACCTVAFKFLEDRPPRMSFFASMAGTALQNLLSTEAVVLVCLDHRCAVDPADPRFLHACAVLAEAPR